MSMFGSMSVKQTLSLNEAYSMFQHWGGGFSARSRAGTLGLRGLRDLKKHVYFGRLICAGVS